MKRNLIIFLILITIQSLSFLRAESNNFPKITILEGDTIFLLNERNLDSVNKIFLQSDEYLRKYKISDSLNMEFKKREKDFKSIINEERQKNKIKDTIISSKDSVIINKDNIINEKEKIIKRHKWIEVGLGILLLISII
jgi:hypothetical protein